MASQELNNAIFSVINFSKIHSFLKIFLLTNLNFEKITTHFLSEINEHILMWDKSPCDAGI